MLFSPLFLLFVVNTLCLPLRLPTLRVRVKPGYSRPVSTRRSPLCTYFASSFHRPRSGPLLSFSHLPVCVLSFYVLCFTRASGIFLLRRHLLPRIPSSLLNIRSSLSHLKTSLSAFLPPPSFVATFELSIVASSSANSSLSSTELFFRVRPSLSSKSIFYYLIRIFPVPGATSLFGGLCLHLSLTLLFLSILVRRPPSRWFCTVFSLLLSFARQIRIFVRIILLLVVPSSFPKQPVCVLSPVRAAPPLRSSELFTPFPPFPRLTGRKRC